MPTSPRDFDVAVVGTGPAGGTAALGLAAAGVRVALLDRDPLPRYKTCGGGIVQRALAVLPGDIAPAVEHTCLRAQVNILSRDLSITCTRRTPIVAMTMRAHLDALLASRAADAGATLIAPRAVTGMELRRHYTVLRTTDGDIRARFVVAADGATGPLARAAGWPPNAACIPAIELEARVDDGVHARFAGTARFDFGLIPHGYAWVFPKRDHLSIGILSARRGRVALQRYLDEYLRRLGVVEREATTRYGYVIPIKPRIAPFVRSRTIVVGDAAGFADPITAEGISYATLSGALAAQAIIGGNLAESGVRDHYEHALRREILPELRTGRWLSRFVYGRCRLQRAVYRLTGRQLAEAVTEVVSGNTTYRRAFANPFTYLRRPAA